MSCLKKRRYVAVSGFSAFLTALSLVGCGPVNIGSDKCDVSSCSGFAKPATVQCADGTSAGSTGACTKTADGSCAWEVTSCSAECTPGATKKADDGCNTCVCAASGTWGCTEMACDGACSVGGIVYPNNSKVPSNDCNTCWCMNGSVGCTLIACGTDPATCTFEECGGRPECATYTCADGSVAGCVDNCYRDASGKCTWEIRSCPAECKPGETKIADDGCNECTCGTTGTFVCTEKACGRTCSYNGKLHGSGESFASTDGCNTCTCSDGTVGCTKMACPGGPLCASGDPGFLDGRCEACTVGADQTCNDDLLMSSIAGSCVNGYCACRNGFAPNPENGKCKKVALTAASVCTPGADQTCNGDIEISSLQGRCLFDGTCACSRTGLDPATGKCMALPM